MDRSMDVTANHEGIGAPLLGPELEEHVLRLGRRNAGGYTGYDEEFLILE